MICNLNQTNVVLIRLTNHYKTAIILPTLKLRQTGTVCFQYKYLSYGKSPPTLKLRWIKN